MKFLIFLFACLSLAAADIRDTRIIRETRETRETREGTGSIIQHAPER